MCEEKELKDNVINENEEKIEENNGKKEDIIEKEDGK